MNFEPSEAATAYGIDTRQDTSRQGVRSLTLFEREGEAFSLLNQHIPKNYERVGAKLHTFLA
jgi:hypothetical protein